jgi:hypothetical protein
MCYCVRLFVQFIFVELSGWAATPPAKPPTCDLILQGLYKGRKISKHEIYGPMVE